MNRRAFFSLFGGAALMPMAKAEEKPAADFTFIGQPTCPLCERHCQCRFFTVDGRRVPVAKHCDSNAPWGKCENDGKFFALMPEGTRELKKFKEEDWLYA